MEKRVAPVDLLTNNSCHGKLNPEQIPIIMRIFHIISLLQGDMMLKLAKKMREISVGSLMEVYAQSCLERGRIL